MTATPQTYAATFEGFHDGRLVLEDLTGRYHDCEQLFVAGQADSTAFRLGAREVLRYIFRRLAEAKDGNPNEEEQTL